MKQNKPPITEIQTIGHDWQHLQVSLLEDGERIGRGQYFVLIQLGFKYF